MQIQTHAYNTLYYKDDIYLKIVSLRFVEALARTFAPVCDDVLAVKVTMIRAVDNSL